MGERHSDEHRLRVLGHSTNDLTQAKVSASLEGQSATAGGTSQLGSEGTPHAHARTHLLLHAPHLRFTWRRVIVGRASSVLRLLCIPGIPRRRRAVRRAAAVAGAIVGTRIVAVLLLVPVCFLNRRHGARLANIAVVDRRGGQVREPPRVPEPRNAEAVATHASRHNTAPPHTEAATAVGEAPYQRRVCSFGTVVTGQFTSTTRPSMRNLVSRWRMRFLPFSTSSSVLLSCSRTTGTRMVQPSNPLLRRRRCGSSKDSPPSSYRNHTSMRGPDAPRGPPRTALEAVRPRDWRLEMRAEMERSSGCSVQDREAIVCECAATRRVTLQARVNVDTTARTDFSKNP